MKTGAPLSPNQWRINGATRSLSRFCAIEFSLRKKASMAQRNNADRCIGAALAQIAMLLLRARSAPNPLCAIGPHSRLAAPLGQKRTLIAGASRRPGSTVRTLAQPARRATARAKAKGRIDLVTPLRVLIFNATPSARSPANPCQTLQRESSVRLCVSAAPRRRAAR
jgi:hypothetical protein